ncbi:MAG: THUMP domain-containing protein [Thermoanaerobaculales bacterium]|jgi:putative N6-adenine-specific DNA methylase|nr:THUMP domain-containing protein [Thermoanaerobaculales bacterium]
MIDAGSSPRPLVATCSRGLEEVLADELRALGAADVAPGRGVVGFSGGLEAVYSANLRLRTAARVVVPLASGRVADRDQLYGLASTVPWQDMLVRGQTIAVEVAGRSPAFANTVFAAQVVKDAVVDRVRDRQGWRPSVDRGAPDLAIHLHLSDRLTAIGLDSTGEVLAHRGYRPRGGPAPLSESLAAGVLLLAGYDGTEPLLDPLCGTGTIAVEAALIATRTAPGVRRRFACERWTGHDAGLLAELRRAADGERRDAPAPIVARDRDQRAVEAAVRNLEAAGMSRWVAVERRDALDLELPWGSGGLIVGNPPYGKRLGETEQLGGFYERLGDQLKQRAADATAWLLVGNRELANRIGLRAARRIPLFNGPIECRLLKYELYRGSRKPSQSS